MSHLLLEPGTVGASACYWQKRSCGRGCRGNQKLACFFLELTQNEIMQFLHQTAELLTLKVPEETSNKEHWWGPSRSVGGKCGLAQCCTEGICTNRLQHSHASSLFFLSGPAGMILNRTSLCLVVMFHYAGCTAVESHAPFDALSSALCDFCRTFAGSSLGRAIRYHVLSQLLQFPESNVLFCD